MKKYKLKIAEIKINSFKTSLINKEKETIVGASNGVFCPEYTQQCYSRICYSNHCFEVSHPDGYACPVNQDSNECYGPPHLESEPLPPF